MANTNCEACNELRTEVPELIVNGFDDDMCASLKNDTGLKTSSGNNDCTDFDTMNDCLIGNMETEIDDYDSCTWKDFMKKYISNDWTMFKGLICAICGIWQNIHDLWTTVRSFRLSKSGSTISLTSNLGSHGSVNDDDTTYELTKDGNTITLTGSDGTTNSVTDDDTTYTMALDDHTLTLTSSDGDEQSVTIPDSGGGGGSGVSYGLSINDHTITLEGSDGSRDSVTVPDENTRYQFHTKTYTLTNVSVVAGDTAVIDVSTPQPSGYTDTLYPMAVAGWTWEGTFASYLVTRYIQLVDRSGSPKVRVAVRNIASAASDGSHDADVTLYVEVFWYGGWTS